MIIFMLDGEDRIVAIKQQSYLFQLIRYSGFILINYIAILCSITYPDKPEFTDFSTEKQLLTLLRLTIMLH